MQKIKTLFPVLLAVAILAACGGDSSTSAGGNSIPEADPNATLVSQVSVGDVYSDMTVRDANGYVIGVFDPNTGYITLNNGVVVTVDGTPIDGLQPSSSSSVSSSSIVVSSSSHQVKPNWAYLNPAISYGEMTDSRDGQVYKTVQIGEQVWMAENLNYDYNEGTAESYCYNNSADSCAKYGRLYLWSAAMDSAAVFGDAGKGCGFSWTCAADSLTVVRGVCPAGWHLPSRAEFETLIAAVGGTYVAETVLKSTSGWTDDGNGTDSYGFSALPAGIRSSGGAFSYAGNYAVFWGATEYSSFDAYYMNLDYFSDYVCLGNSYKDLARSVRCLRDSRL